MSNVAFYIRLSKEDGDKSESDSIVSQRKILQQFILEKPEFLFTDEYVDDGYTGTNFNRPEFIRMIEDINNKKINCVIVKDLSRFGRDYIDVGQYLQKIFPQNNIRFVAVNENIDSLKTKYDLMMPIRNILNEQYARDISDKVIGSLRAKQKNGDFIGAFATYGFLKDDKNKNKIIVDEYSSLIVKRIFKSFIEGYSKLAIASSLNNDGVLCPSEYKKSQGLNYTNNHKLTNTNYWTHSTIHKILKNEIYIGNMIQHKNNRSRYSNNKTTVPEDDWIKIANTHQSIIDKNTWNLTKTLLLKNTRVINFNQNVSIFAGFLKCGDCGRAMSKVERHGKINYICGTYKRYTSKYCSQHKILYSQLEDIILNKINEIINNIEQLEEMVKECQLGNKEINNKKNIQKEILKCELELERILKFKKSIYEDFKTDIITKEEYLAYKDDYNKQELALKQKNNTLIKESESNVELFLESKWISDIKKYKQVKELDRFIISTLINYIEIYEGNTIHIDYKINNELQQLKTHL